MPIWLLRCTGLLQVHLVDSLQTSCSLAACRCGVLGIFYVADDDLTMIRDDMHMQAGI